MMQATEDGGCKGWTTLEYIGRLSCGIFLCTMTSFGQDKLWLRQIENRPTVLATCQGLLGMLHIPQFRIVQRFVAAHKLQLKE